MATRNETTDVRQTGRTSDSERALQTGREGRSQTGLMRSDIPAGGPVRSPFALVRRVMDDMDRMLDDFGFGGGLTTPLLSAAGRDLWADAFERGSALWSPAVEVFDRGDKLVVRAEIPGVSKEDVNVDVTDNTLTIEGERRQETEDRGEGYYRSERSYGRFFRSIPLPEGVDRDKVEAKFKDGVLEVTLPAPKRERKRGRKIAIR